MWLDKELSLGSSALWVDWARNVESDEITVGVATRDGKFITITPETWTQKDVVELDPPTPIWKVVGNHYATSADCEFALATLNAGVIGIKVGKGVCWQHPFGSSCGALTLAHRPVDGKQIIIAGALDKTLRGIEIGTGKLVWGQVFLEGVGFVDIFNVGGEIQAIAGDTAGNVRCFDAYTGLMRWHGEFGNNARFCIPILNHESNTFTWIVGTDARAINFFEIDDKGKTSTLISVPMKDFPWQARVCLNTAIISTYNFTNLEGPSISTPGEISALSRNGEILWTATLSGCVEDFEIFSRNAGEELDLFAATNAGMVAWIEPHTGGLIDKLSLSVQSINCIKSIPISKPSEIRLVAACDDGRVILLKSLK